MGRPGPSVIRTIAALAGFAAGIACLPARATPSAPPANPVEACQAQYGDDFRPVSGPMGHARRALDRPTPAAPVPEPTYGTCLLRVTDHHTQPVEGAHARNFYSRFQAFNRDDSRMLVASGDGQFQLYDARTLQHVRPLTEVGGHDGEPQWHPTHPQRLRYMPPDNRAAIAELDLASGRSTTLVDFSGGRHAWGRLGQVRTRWEGSPSVDGRYWCLMAYDPGGRFLGVFSYDLEGHDVLGMKRMQVAPDHVGTSPSGRYCVVSHARQDGGTVAWRRDFSRSRKLHAASEHSDLAIGADGEDLYVFVDYDSDGALVALDIDTGARRALLDTYAGQSATAYHVSARNVSRPGWVLLSTYAAKPPRQWFHDRINAIELAAGPRMLTLADHRSAFEGYATAPMATVNRDFTRVLFSSNWGAGEADDVEVYMIVLPDGLLDAPGR